MCTWWNWSCSSSKRFAVLFWCYRTWIVRGLLPHYILTYLLTNTMVAFHPLSCLFTCVCVCSIFYCVTWHNNCITSTRRLTTTTTINQQQLQHRIIHRHGECRRHHCCTNITLLQCKATRIGTTLTCWITTMTILLIVIILLIVRVLRANSLAICRDASAVRCAATTFTIASIWRMRPTAPVRLPILLFS